MQGTRARRPTRLIPWFSKLREILTLLCCITLSSSRENQQKCSRGSKKDFWRRCRGGLRKSQHTKYPSQSLISRITLFAICLSFSSPQLHPCRFIRPLFPLAYLFCLPLVCLFALWLCLRTLIFIFIFIEIRFSGHLIN